MTVVQSLDEHKRYSRPRDREFIDSVNDGRFRQLKLVQSDTAFIETLGLDDRNRQRRRAVYDSGYGRGVQERERYGFNVQPFKPRNSRLARFETLATIMIAVCLYALVIAALLHVLLAK